MSPGTIYQKLIEAGFSQERVLKFKQFHDENSDIWKAFETEALRIAQLKPTYYSADDVAHAVRHQLRKEINNNWISFYARVFAFKYPTFSNLFRFKKVG